MDSEGTFPNMRTCAASRSGNGLRIGPGSLDVDGAVVFLRNMRQAFQLGESTTAKRPLPRRTSRDPLEVRVLGSTSFIPCKNLAWPPMTSEGAHAGERQVLSHYYAVPALFCW
jgi:hypothetical protein